jgi:hypothetical protein
MASVVPNSFKKDLLQGNINLGADTIKVMLLTSSYTPDQDAHAKRSDLTASEVSGTGYTAGGMTLANKTFTQDNTNNLGYFDCDDPLWTGATITARYCALYKSRGGAASADELGPIYDFGSNITSTNGPFTITVNAAGLIQLT